MTRDSLLAVLKIHLIRHWNRRLRHSIFTSVDRENSSRKLVCDSRAERDMALEHHTFFRDMIPLGLALYGFGISCALHRFYRQREETNVDFYSKR